MRKQGALIFLVLCTLSVPFLVGGWVANVDGRRVLMICLGQQEVESVVLPFFQGGAARCTGNEVVIWEAYHAAVLEPNARLDIVRGIFPQDLEMARAAVSAHPDQSIAHFWLASALNQAGEISGAILAYETGLELEPVEGEEWDQLGRLYEASGDWEQAVHAFDQACHYVDRGKQGCISAARLYMDHHMYAEALARYQDALIQLPGFHPVLWGLTDALIALDRPGEAIPHLEILAARGDGEAQALLDDLQQVP